MIPTDLDAARRIALLYESDPIADTVNAIIHRREGNFGKSITWWRKVGFAAPEQVVAVYPDSDPVAFVRAAQRGDKSLLALVEQAELAALRKVVCR